MLRISFSVLHVRSCIVREFRMKVNFFFTCYLFPCYLVLCIITFLPPQFYRIKLVYCLLYSLLFCSVSYVCTCSHCWCISYEAHRLFIFLCLILYIGFRLGSREYLMITEYLSMLSASFFPWRYIVCNEQFICYQLFTSACIAFPLC